MTTTSKPLMMRVEDVAEEMRCSTRTVWNRVDAGVYPKPVKDCGSTRWRRCDIEAYVESLGGQLAGQDFRLSAIVIYLNGLCR